VECYSAYYGWSFSPPSSHSHPPDATLTTEFGVINWILGAAIMTEVCHLLTPPCTRVTNVTLVEQIFFLLWGGTMAGGFPVVTTIVEIDARVAVMIVVMAMLGSGGTSFTGASTFQV